MNRTNRLILGAVVLGSTLLAGCASNAKIDQLSSDVQCNAANNFGLMCNQFWIAILSV
ncbi:hypothetical protein GJL21_01690 [Salmonella enterica]|nr:hypothetical protein [Salmonella enterica]